MVALLVVLPFRTVEFTRSDGVVVKLPAPDRLNHTSDTWDYLQIAREIYRSHQYESLFTYVPFLPEWAPSDGKKSPVEINRFPVVWRQPGFPLLVAGAFAIRGEPDPGVLSWIQGAAILLLPLATYFLGLALLTPQWAFAAALWTLLTPLVVSPGSPFVATTWFAVIVSFLAACILRSGPVWILILCGTLLGLAIGFRLETWFLLPGLLLLLWMGQSSRKMFYTVMLLGVAALVLVPWTRCRAQCVGETFTLTSLLYHDTDTFPGWTSSRTLAVRELSALGFVTDHFGEVMKKSGLNLLRYGRDLALLPSPFLAPFVWLTVLRPPVEPRQRTFVFATLLMTLILVLALAPLEYSPRFIAVLVPFFTLTATLGVARFVRHRRILVVAASVVGLLLMGGTLVRRPANGTARQAAEDLNLVLKNPAESFQRAGWPVIPWIAFCDAPTIYAWIWNARAVWTPLPEDVRKLARLIGHEPVAVFTRAGGRGDGLASDTIARYFQAGLRADKREAPVLMTWPPPSRQGPVTPEGSPP